MLENGTRRFSSGMEFIERAVLGHIQHALVHAEKELRFAGIIDCHRGQQATPCSS